jgi:endonuclease/exonuclease/phosphatase family metal-dependent hydrolase
MLTHNVRGLSCSNVGKLHALVRLWSSLNVDFICVQETHLKTHQAIRSTEFQLQAAARELGVSPFRCFWCCRSAPTGLAGVAILVRSNLMESGQLTIPTSPPSVQFNQEGRLLSLPIVWGGHKLTVACVYFPSGDSLRQKLFITDHISPLYRSTAGRLALLGDFNFVMNPERDRRQPPPGPPSDPMAAGPSGIAQSGQARPSLRGSNDVATAQLFSDQCPLLVLFDTYILLATPTLSSDRNLPLFWIGHISPPIFSSMSSIANQSLIYSLITDPFSYIFDLRFPPPLVPALPAQECISQRMNL